MLPAAWKARVVSWLEEHRELLLVAVGLPASLALGLLLRLRAAARRLAAGSHDDRVREIQRRMLVWNQLPANGRRLLCSARPNWLSLSTTFFQKHLHHQVPIPLYDILGLDEANMTVRVEPMITIGDITKFLIPRGYSLAVTIELDDATLGGLAFGTGMSTHSHKAGLYHETVLSYEVVVADGSVVTATADNEHKQLFRALPWSHGSLGFLVGLTIRIVKIKPYIKIKYIPVTGQENYCKMMKELSGAYEEKPKAFQVIGYKNLINFGLTVD